MTEWVSQAEARRLLGELGDAVSQPGLSQYLAGHPEVIRESAGQGKAMKIDWESLKLSRQSRRSRGPAEAPLLDVPAPEPKVEAARPEPIRNEMGDRKAAADVSRAESDARRARILADEAEGRMLPRQAAANAFIAAGAALVRTLEEQRRPLIDAVRAARDHREADLAVKAYERTLRAKFASSLADLAAAELSMAAQ
jgi:hypothetical protein